MSREKGGMTGLTSQQLVHRWRTRAIPRIKYDAWKAFGSGTQLKDWLERFTDTPNFVLIFVWTFDEDDR